MSEAIGQPENGEEFHKLQDQAKAYDMILVKGDTWAQTRGLAAMAGPLTARFVSDGEGGVIGPSLAEPEVWARLHQLECGAEGEGVDIGDLAAAVLKSLGFEVYDETDPLRYARLAQVLHDWFKSPKEAAKR